MLKVKKVNPSILLSGQMDKLLKVGDKKIKPVIRHKIVLLTSKNFIFNIL